jgi:hypothetical protein
VRPRAHAVAIAFLLAASSSADAQAIRLEHRPPDCNLARPAFDNPFSDRAGWTMPRYAWHGFYAALSTASAEGLHHLTGWPRWSTALIASVGIGFIPHVRQVILAPSGQRTINVRDWAFDGFVRSAPLILWTGTSDGTWQSKTLAATTLLGGYFSLACWGSP